MIERKTIADGVRFFRCGGGFRKNRMVVYLHFPLTRETLTSSALVPYLLERGTRNLPDNILLRRTLQGMYGAQLSSGYGLRGMSRVLDFSISGADGSLVGEGEDVRRARLLLDVLLDPALEGGAFRADWLDIEKGKLRDAIRAVVNDKRDYCHARLAKAAYDDVRALPDDGIEDDLDDVTPDKLYRDYRDILSNAQIEIFFVGEGADEIEALCRERFAALTRSPAAVPAIPPLTYTELRTTTEAMPVEQDKLAQLYTTGSTLDAREYAALRLGSFLFGGGATSRLFNNVREKESLCYYVSSSQTLRPGGGIVVDSGVSHQNLDRVRDAIARELRALVKDGPTEVELRDAKLYFESAFRGIGDTARSVTAYHFNRIVRDGETGEPEDELRLIRSVSADEIIEVLSRLTLRAESTITVQEDRA